MKYKVIANDHIYGRMLSLELDRAGFPRGSDSENDFRLLVAEGQTELPKNIRLLRAAVLVDCGILAGQLSEAVNVLILDRPFALEELRGFLEKVRQDEENSDEDENGVMIFPDDMSVVMGDKCSQLTKREYDLFQYLYKRPGITVSRSELLKSLWHDENARDTNVVDVYVRFLRTKLDDKFGLKLIHAVRGEGYYYFADIPTK